MNFLKSILNNKYIKHLFYIIIQVVLLYSLTGNKVLASVTSDFNKANILFKKGKYKSSAKILTKIIKKYPAYKASYFLMGRIFYNLGYPKKAAKYFSHSSLAFLSDESAFEYGASMFVAKKYSRAINGFKKINKKNKNLAYFYIGICYIHKKKWHLAERSLRHARKLPPEFQKAKLNLLRELQKKQRRLSRGYVPRSVPYSQIPVPTPFYPQAYVKQQRQPATSSNTKQPDVVAAQTISSPKGFSASITPQTSYSLYYSKLDYHSRLVGEQTLKGPIAGVDLNLRYDSDEFAKQLSIIFPVSGNYKDYKNSSRSSQYYAFEDDPSAIFIKETLNNDPLSDTDKSIKCSLKPEIDIALNSIFTVKGGYSFEEYFINMKTDNTQNIMGPFGALELNIYEHIISISGSYMTTDKNTGGLTNDFSVTGSINGPITVDSSYNFIAKHIQTAEPLVLTLFGYQSKDAYELTLKRSWDSVSLDIAGGYYLNTLPENTFIFGQTSEIKASGILTVPISVITLSATVEFSYMPKYIITDVPINNQSLIVEDTTTTPSTTNLTLTAQSQKVSIGANFSPFEWIYLNCSYYYNLLSYTLETPNTDKGDLSSNADIKAAYEKLVPNIIWGYDISVGLSRTF